MEVEINSEPLDLLDTLIYLSENEFKDAFKRITNKEGLAFGCTIHPSLIVIHNKINIDPMDLQKVIVNSYDSVQIKKRPTLEPIN